MILGRLAANLPLLRKVLTGNGVTRDTTREDQDF